MRVWPTQHASTAAQPQHKPNGEGPKARQQRQNYFFTSYPRRLQQHAHPRPPFLCRLTHPLPTRKDGRRFPSNGDSQELQSALYGFLVCIPGFSDNIRPCRKLALVRSDLQRSSLTIIASQGQRTLTPRCRCVAYELCFGTVSADTHNCPFNSESHIILAISLVCTRQPRACERV